MGQSSQLVRPLPEKAYGLKPPGDITVFHLAHWHVNLYTSQAERAVWL